MWNSKHYKLSFNNVSTKKIFWLLNTINDNLISIHKKKLAKNHFVIIYRYMLINFSQVIKK